jgi:hypothetical protein
MPCSTRYLKSDKAPFGTLPVRGERSVLMSNPTFLEEIGIEEGEDLLLIEIHHDLKGKSSTLELLSDYLDEIRGTLGNDTHAYAKLAKLFERGRAPERVEGHFFGVTLGLRTGNRKGLLSRYGNILNLLWGTILAKAPPWVGKGTRFMDASFREQYLEGVEESEVPEYLGINYFRRNKVSFLNRVSLRILTAMLGLKEAPEDEKDAYGHDKTGGRFIARRDKSVNPGAEEKYVFQINYRWASLKSRLPLNYLIDEIVEIADGLYLGQLLFATKRLRGEFDPSLPCREYGYSHFGYFLLMDERWNEERRRLFPYTEDIWRTRGSSIRWAERPKFTNFTFAEPPDGRCSEELLRELMRDFEGKETILDLLKFYSDQLGKDLDIHSPYFSKLLELFNRAVAPREVKGYFHGAVVAFRNEGFIKTFDINILNLAWPLARHFSPWTGKTFEDIEIDRLVEVTDSFEKGDVPTFWGTNTYASRTAKQKLVVEAMRLANIEVQDVTDEEERSRGYDVKSFFFIARQGISVNPDNNGKTAFLFNYRWPKLRSFPPDNYCIDELVQIAEGLYLGQLVYATRLLEKYDPTKPSSDYNYRNFGYFLLMDDEWHARRIEIGFDISLPDG